MALSMVEYVGQAGQQSFAVPFPFLHTTDLKVLVNKSQHPFTFRDNAVHLLAPLPEDSLVLIQRETSVETRLVDFSDMANLSEADLDTDSLQAFYALQELLERKSQTLDLVDGMYWDMKGLYVRYVADPEHDLDAVNLRTVRVAFEAMDDKVLDAIAQVHSALEDIRLIALECQTYLNSARAYSDHAEGSMIQAEAAAKAAEDSHQMAKVEATLSEKSRIASMTHADRSEVAAENSQQSAVEAEDTRLETDGLRIKAEKAAVDAEQNRDQAGTEALNSNAYAVTSQLAANDAALSKQMALEGASTSAIEAAKAQGFASAAEESLTTVRDYSTQAQGSAESALIAQGATEAAQAAVAASKESVDHSTIQAKQAADKAVQEASEADASAIAAKNSQAQSEEILRRVTELVGSITHNGLMDAGAFDASTGVLPAKPELSSYWLVTASGTCGELELATGDTLVYSATMDTFYKIDSTDNVVSVNGQKGAVVLTAEDVGALTPETGAEHFQAKGEYAAAQHSHERDQIVGMEGQTPDATIELAEDNLNDITGAGFYRQGLNAAATAERNYPVAEAGLLFVSTGSYGMQEYTGYQTNVKYIRSLDAHGVWSAWVLPKGEKGEKGDKGDQGVQGVNGVMGPAGAIGPKGDVGAEGPQGVQGPIGPKGDKGDPGMSDPASVQPVPDTLVKRNASGEIAAKGRLAITSSSGSDPLTGRGFIDFVTDSGTSYGRIGDINDFSSDLCIRSDSGLAVLTMSGNAQKVKTGGLLCSDAFSDETKVPANGAYIKGNVDIGQQIRFGKEAGSGTNGILKHQNIAGGEAWITAVDDTNPDHKAIGVSQAEGAKFWDGRNGMKRIYHEGFKPNAGDVGLGLVHNRAFIWEWGNQVPTHMWGSKGDANYHHVFNGDQVRAFVGLDNIGKGDANTLSINTVHGNVYIGPLNGGHCHYMTNMPNHYFNKELRVQGNVYVGAGYNQLLMAENGSYNTATFRDWVRTEGNTGWYNATHGGGMTMVDNVWVRTSHGKKLYVENNSPDAIHSSGGITVSGDIRGANVYSHGAALSTRWKRGYQNQNGAGSHTHVGLPHEAIVWLNQGNDVEFRILHKNGGYMGDHSMVVPYTAWNGGATEYVQHVANVGHCWLFIGGSSKGQCKAEYQGVTHIYYRLAV